MTIDGPPGSCQPSGTRPTLGHAVLGGALVLVLGTVQAAAIEPAHDLLGELDLPPAAIRVNLDRATVTVVYDAGEVHTIRWWRARPDEPGTDSLSVSMQGDGVFVERGERLADDPLAELAVEIHAPPGHPLFVGGSALDLSVTQEKNDEEESDQEQNIEDIKATPVRAPPITVELDISESIASLTGTSAVTGVGRGCTVELMDTIGDHSLDLSGGEIRVASHRGNATFTADDTIITIEGMQGSLSTQVTAGSLDLRSSVGMLNIRHQNGQIQLAEVRGSGSIVTSGSNVDLRDLQLSKLTIQGEDSYFSAADGSGTITVNLRNGFFGMSGSRGTLSGIIRDDADIEMSDFVGDATVTLEEGTSGDFSDIKGVLALTARNAHVTVNTAERLSLTAQNSYASLAGIDQLTSFQVDYSEIELDFSDRVVRRLNIAVLSESRVGVRLPTPCRVEITGASENLGNRVEVSGCELKLGRRGRWSTRGVRGMDGQAPVLLNAQVSESSTLTVEGRP